MAMLDRLVPYIFSHQKDLASRINWGTDADLVENGYLTEVYPSFYSPTPKALELWGEFQKAGKND